MATLAPVPVGVRPGLGLLPADGALPLGSKGRLHVHFRRFGTVLGEKDFVDAFSGSLGFDPALGEPGHVVRPGVPVVVPGGGRIGLGQSLVGENLESPTPPAQALLGNERDLGLGSGHDFPGGSVCIRGFPYVFPDCQLDCCPLGQRGATHGHCGLLGLSFLGGPGILSGLSFGMDGGLDECFGGLDCPLADGGRQFLHVLVVGVAVLCLLVLCLANLGPSAGFEPQICSFVFLADADGWMRFKNCFVACLASLQVVG